MNPQWKISVKRYHKAYELCLLNTKYKDWESLEQTWGWGGDNKIILKSWNGDNSFSRKFAFQLARTLQSALNE